MNNSKHKLKERQAKQRLEVAYHEAGHAVVSHFKRVGFKYVTIRPNVDEGSLGHVRNRHAGWFIDAGLISMAPDLWLENCIISTFAGQMAGRLVTPKYNHVGAGSDNDTITSLALARYGSGDEASAEIRKLREYTKQFVNHSHIKKCIAAVAEALLNRETLSRREVREIIQAQGDVKIERRKRKPPQRIKPSRRPARVMPVIRVS